MYPIEYYHALRLSGHVNGLLNDMVVDSPGRAYVGEFGFDLMGGADLKPGVSLRVDPGGTVTKAAEDMWFPNGSVITEDGTLLVCETFGNRVSAFDIGEDGALDNRRTWAKFGEPPADGNSRKCSPRSSLLPTVAAWTRTRRCG
jgi:sugar lactone lactonase YvrE